MVFKDYMSVNVIILYTIYMAKYWLGVIGQNGSGKSLVCDYLKSKGFRVVSLSDVVRKHATDLNIGHDRDSLTSLANSLKEDHGIDFFAREVASGLSSTDEYVVFDSVRHPLEVDYLEKNHNVYFIGIKATLETRYERICKRGKETDKVSFADFKRQDEYETLGSSYGQLIGESLSLCHVIINNELNICNLEDQIYDIIKDKLVK